MKRTVVVVSHTTDTVGVSLDCSSLKLPSMSTGSLRQTLGLSSSMKDVAPGQQRQLVVGHRGAIYEALENTRESFAACRAMKCPAVELDVFVLEDGTVVVFHGGGDDDSPGDLSEYCLKEDGRGILDCKTFAETQTLKFNPEFAEFPCPRHFIETAKIPTLEQVLLDCKGCPIEVKIELKGPGTVQPVLDLVERLQMTDQCSYSSFDHDRLQELRQLRSDTTKYPTAALFDKVTLPAEDERLIEAARRCGATAVHLQYDTCTVKRVRAIRDAGMTSMAWWRGPRGMKEDLSELYGDMGTDEGEPCYQAVLDTGVDELCVNKPNVLLKMFNGP